MDHDSWSKREAILNRFELEWGKANPPELTAFLDALTPPLRQDDDLLTELAVIDLEHRLRAGSVIGCEHYLTQFASRFASPEMQKTLIAGEVSVRSYLGRPVTLTELQQRFPQFADECDAWISASSDAVGPDKSRSRPMSSLADGTVLGDYELGPVIGSGSFSTVYSAIDQRSGQKVAVKLLNPRVAEQEGHRQRMLREARAAASVDHPNVVGVLDVGVFEGSDYIVSCLIEGDTLEDRLSKSECSHEQAARIVIQLARGIHESHNQGIVHRDLKPANILMQDDTPLITDFGLAQLTDATQHLTHEGDLLGTPSYMAPEQAAGHGWLADPRADVYSLGVILFRLITKRLPFEGTTSEVLSQVLHHAPPSPRRIAANVPVPLDTITLKCLEKEPSDRYQTAEALALDLERHITGRTIHAKRPGPVSRILKWSRRRPASASGLLAILLLTAFLIGSLLQLGRVGDERDRAVAAETQAVESEQQKQVLLAAAAADAGILAMQRGHLSQAVAHFDQSLAQNVEDDLPLRLRRIDALMALRRVDDARAEFDLVSQHSDSERFNSQITLWHAELQLEPDATGEDAIELFEQALPGLTGADADYCAGMLAANSLIALEHFRDAAAADLFHRRARRMLITTLLSLARTEETRMQIEQSRALYPEDAAIPFLESLALARLGRLGEVWPIIDGYAASDEEAATWKRFCSAIGAVEFDMGDDESSVDLQSLSQFAADVVTDFRPLMLERGLRIPPRVGRAFEGLPERLAKKPVLRLPSRFSEFLKAEDPEIDEIRASLETIADVHPEMSLMTLLGYIHLLRKDFDACRDTLEEALNHRPWIPNTEQGARFNLCTVAIIRALVDQQEPERNLRVLVTASDGLDAEYVRTNNSYRAIVIGLMNAEEYFKAERFVDAWMTCEDCYLSDCLWHKALIELQRGDLLAVLSVTDQLLDPNPDFDPPVGPRRQHIMDLQVWARGEIENVMSAGESAEGDAKALETATNPNITPTTSMP